MPGDRPALDIRGQVYGRSIERYIRDGDAKSMEQNALCAAVEIINTSPQPATLRFMFLETIHPDEPDPVLVTNAFGLEVFDLKVDLSPGESSRGVVRVLSIPDRYVNPHLARALWVHEVRTDRWIKIPVPGRWPEDSPLLKQ